MRDEYDSVLGDRVSAVGTYKEFVFYEEQAIYPEYLVLYNRLYSEKDVRGQPDNPETASEAQLGVGASTAARGPVESVNASDVRETARVADGRRSSLLSGTAKTCASSGSRVRFKQGS